MTPQVNAIRTQERGETVVPVVVTDAAGISPIACEMTWAWTPKVRAPKAAPAEKS